MVTGVLNSPIHQDALFGQRHHCAKGDDRSPESESPCSGHYSHTITVAVTATQMEPDRHLSKAKLPPPHSSAHSSQ